LQRRGDFFPLIPLDFNHAIFARPPTPTRLFEMFRQGFVVVWGQVQVFNQRYHLTTTAFGGALYDGRLLGGREGSALPSDWRRFAPVAVLGRIHENVVVPGHT
jgi:hypothetical protein